MNKKNKTPLTTKQVEMLKASALLCVGNQHKTALKCIDDLLSAGVCRPFSWSGTRKHIAANDVSDKILKTLELANEYGAKICYYKGNDAKRNGKAGDFIKVVKKHFVSEVSIYNDHINVKLSDGRNVVMSGYFGDHYLTSGALSKLIILNLSAKRSDLSLTQQTVFMDERSDKIKTFVGSLSDFVSKS